MPGTKSDGSITIDTRLDNSGFDKGSDRLKNAVRSLKNQVNRTGDQIRNAFQFDFGQPKQSANTFMKALRGVSSEIDELGRTGKAALEGDAEALQRFQAESNAVMEKLEGMKEELNEFGKTEFMTPEYKKAAGLYQKADARVKELNTALEEAIKKQDNLYKSMAEDEKGSYRKAINRINELKTAAQQYYQAIANGDSETRRALMGKYGFSATISPESLIKEARKDRNNALKEMEKDKAYVAAKAEVDKLADALEKAEKEAEALKAQMEATPATFEGYESTEYEKDQAALQQVIDKLLAYRQLVREGIGSSTAPSAEWDAVQEKWQNMASLSGMIKGAFQSMASTISSGARTAGSAVLTGLQHPIQLVDRALGTAAAGAWRATQALAGMAETAIVNGLQRIASAARQAAVNLAGMVKAGIQTGLKKLGTAITNLGHRSKKSNNIVAMSFKNMLKYGLGIRSLYALFNKLRNAISSGFGELAQVDKEFNFVMSSFKTSVTALKNSVAAAIAPIVKTLLPYVTQFVNYMSAALDKVGQFFAALTGQSEYAKVVPVWQDYAESVKNTGDNAKKSAAQLKKEKKAAEEAALTIAGFDDVEILKDKDKDEEEEDPDQFAMTPVSQAMSDLANKVKDAWAKADFTEFGRMLGEKLKNALENIPWDAIKDILRRIAKSIATFLNGFLETPGLFSLIGKTIAEGINSAFEFLYAFIHNFHWDSLGEAIRDMILGALLNIDWALIFQTMRELGAGIGTALQNALNDPEVWTAIFTTLANAFNSVVYGLYEFLMSIDWASLGRNFTTGLIQGLNTLDWPAIFDTASKIGLSIGEFLQGALNNPQIWTAIFQTLANGLNAAIYMLYEFVTAIDWANLGSNIATGLNRGIEMIDWEMLGKTLSKIINAAFDLWYNFVRKTNFHRFGEHIGTTLSNAVKEIDWTKGGASVAATINGLFDALDGFIQETDWKALGQAVIDVISGFFDEFDWGTVASILSGLASGLWDALTGAIDEVDWDELPGKIIQAIKDYFEGAHFDELAESLGGLLESAIGAVFELVPSLLTALAGLGVDIIGGIASGIGDFIKDGAAWVKEHIFDPIVNGIKSVFGIASPATEMKPFGQYIIEGLLNGITEFFSDPLGWVKEHIFDPIIDGIKSLFGIGEGAEGSSVLFDLGVSVINGLLGGVASLVGSVVAEFGKILTDVKEGFTGLTETISTNLQGLKVPESFMQDTTDLNTLLQDMYAAVDQLGQNSEISSGQLNTLYDAVSDAATNSTTASDALDRMYIACQNAGIGSDQLRDACGEAGANLDTLCNELAGAEGSVDSFAGTNEAAGDEMVEAWKTYNSGVTTEVNSATANAQDKAQAMSTEVQASNADIDSDTSKKWNSIYSSIVTAFGNVYRDVNSKMDDLSRLLHRRFESLATHLPNHFDGVGAAVATHLETLPAAVENVLNTVRMKFTEVNWTELGANIGQGIYNGLDQKRQELNTLAWNSANDMYKNACAALGIASPSKVFAWIGEMIPAGLKKGVDQAADGAIGAVTSLAGALAGEAEDASSAIRINVLETGVDGLDDVLSSFSDKVLSGFDQMISAMDDIINRTAFRIPAVATGSVTPYSARRASANDEREDLPDLLRNAILGDPGRITREDLMEILTNICRQYMNFDFYLGDEQIARHANSGNLKLDRRYRAVTR